MTGFSLGRWAYLIVVILCAGSVGASWFAIQDIHNAVTQNRVTLVLAIRALCNQKQTLQREIRQSKDFLRIHPHGLDGFTADLIHKNIADTRVLLVAFSDVKC